MTHSHGIGRIDKLSAEQLRSCIRSVEYEIKQYRKELSRLQPGMRRGFFLFQLGRYYERRKIFIAKLAKLSPLNK